MKNITKEQKNWTDSMREKYKGQHVRAFNDTNNGPVGVKLNEGDLFLIEEPPEKMDLSLGRIVLLNCKELPPDLASMVRTAHQDMTVFFASREYLYAGGHDWGNLGSCKKYYNIRDRWEYY